MEFARIEITPDNKNYLAPNKWTFHVDERVAPSWLSDAYVQFAMNEHKKWLAKLDTILIRKPIVHPFRDVVPPKRITKKHLALLRVWAIVGARVGAWVVRASVGAYIGSFFDLPELQKYQPCVKLWDIGLVPSFDGKTWRLHGGTDANVLWSGTVEELEKTK